LVCGVKRLLIRRQYNLTTSRLGLCVVCVGVWCVGGWVVRGEVGVGERIYATVIEHV
jgi:hypothetical protein